MGFVCYVFISASAALPISEKLHFHNNKMWRQIIDDLFLFGFSYKIIPVVYKMNTNLVRILGSCMYLPPVGLPQKTPRKCPLPPGGQSIYPYRAPADDTSCPSQLPLVL